MNIYDRTQWEADRTFNAAAGQEITEEIYNEMLNCMPPLNLPRNKARQALEALNISVHAGFLMGEPHSSNKGGLLYLAFGMNDYGKGKHYYYLGLSHAAKKLNGEYYYMDCLNAFVNDGLFKVSEFKDEQEAIDTAANYEAALYKYTYKDGERVSNALIYDPFKCFETANDTERK